MSDRQTHPTATVASALQAARQQGLERLDAELLMGAVLGKPRSWLLAHDTDALPDPALSAFLALVDRRAQGEPVAYLLGHKEFFGLTLSVSAEVLVPRPDTEVLVEWALELLQAGSGHPHPAVLDLGTGSGAIALAIQHQHPRAQVTAVDASAGALAVAQANAARLGLPVRFQLGSWLTPVAGTRFDLIVSNPPYIADDDPHLRGLTHEPKQALTSGPDGLDDIRWIAAHAPAHLLPGGWLLFEHGWDQADAVAALLQHHGFVNVTSREDLGGHRRCTGGHWPSGGPSSPLDGRHDL